MSGGGVLALIGVATALATLGTASIGLVVALRNKKDIHDIHILINSRMDELLEQTRKNARAEGVIEGEGR